MVTVLNRGGRFQDYKKAYKDGQMANKYGKMLGIYFDKLVSTKNSMTGKPYLGHADYIEGPQDCTGKLINDEAQGYDFTLITYKTISQTKSRTIGNYWLDALLPENFIEIAAADAQRLGLNSGDQVKVVSASNEEGLWDLGQGQKKPMIGKVRVQQGLRPGWWLFPWASAIGPTGRGRWSLTALSIAGDTRRATGIHANAAMRLDPVLKNTGLVDPVGGSAVFYQSQVKLVKV